MDTFLYSLIFFIFGCIIGSFLNVVIWRTPRGEEISGRSHCPHCGRELRAVHLIPVVSFIFLGGRCAFCRKPVSWRYVMIELATGVLFALCGMLNPLAITADYLLLVRSLFIVSVLVVVFVIDLEHYLILDAIIFPASVVLFLLNFVVDYATGAQLISLVSFSGGGLFAALVTGGFFASLYFMSRGKWIGFGDVKFMLFFGLAALWPGSLVGLMLAFWIGSAVSLVLVAFGKKTMVSKVPFGTFLSVGVLLAMLWSGPILQWYWVLIGF